jgi:hypothetical protein
MLAGEIGSELLKLFACYLATRIFALGQCSGMTLS